MQERKTSLAFQGGVWRQSTYSSGSHEGVVVIDRGKVLARVVAHSHIDAGLEHSPGVIRSSRVCGEDLLTSRIWLSMHEKANVRRETTEALRLMTLLTEKQAEITMQSAQPPGSTHLMDSV